MVVNPSAKPNPNPWLGGALAFAIAAPSVVTGFCTDDHGFRAALRAGRPAWDLFRFAPADVSRGGMPWWAAPDLKIHFLRPLTSLLFAVDARVFGTHAFAYHLDSVLWYVALVVGVGHLYRVLFDGKSALFATIAFALAGGHAGAYGWVSARHILVGAVPVVFALLLHIRGRYILAALTIALGLAGSEAAAAGALYLALFSLVERQLRALVPLAIVGAVYVALYRLGHFGVAASGAYHDPIASPIRFAILALVRIPALLGGGLQPLIGIALIALYAVSYFGARKAIPEREKNALRWLVPGALAALAIVGGSGIPSGRLLVVPDIGLAALVGVLIARTKRPLAYALGLVAFVAGPLAALWETRALWERGRSAEAIAERIDHESGDAKVLFVVASDPLVFLYARGVLADIRERHVCWSALAAAPGDYTLARTAERAFTLTPERPLGTTLFELLFRSKDKLFAVGDEVHQCGAAIRIAAVTDGHPTKLTVELERPRIEHIAFLDGSGSRVALPEVGATVTITQPKH